MMSAFSSSLSIALMSEQAGERTAWVHLVPAGTFTGIDGRGPYHLKDANAVIAATRAHHGRKQIVFDYEHQTGLSRKNGNPAPAAGWIVGLEARHDGIWGLVEWTETAAAHIAKREYRYVSPVFYHRKDDGTVTLLENAALTNAPNLDQLIALNRAEEPMENPELTGKVREAAALLGMPETATQTVVMSRLAEIAKLSAELSALTGDTSIAQNRAVPDPAQFVPIGDFQRTVAELNKLRSGVTKERAEAHVADHIRAGHLPPFMKEWAVSLCSTNLSAFDDFVKGVGPGFTHILQPSHASALPPGHLTSHKAGDDLTEDELTVCRNMGLTPEQFTNARQSSAMNKE